MSRYRPDVPTMILPLLLVLLSLGGASPDAAPAAGSVPNWVKPLPEGPGPHAPSGDAHGTAVTDGPAAGEGHGAATDEHGAASGGHGAAADAQGAAADAHGAKAEGHGAADEGHKAAGEGNGEGEGHGEGHGEHGEGEEHEHPAAQADVGIAATLFGSVSFVMILFYLVNWLDDDIRRYSWSIISTTLTIFIAVLAFNGIDELVRAAKPSRLMLVLTEYLLFFLLFLTLQVFCAFQSGVICEPEPVDLDEEVWVIADGLRADFGQQVPEYEVRNRTGVKSIAYIDKLEVFVQKKKLSKETRQRRMKCWAILIAHMTGFAGINAGGALQRADFFSQNPFTALLVVLINQALFWGLFRIADCVRGRICKKKRGFHDHRMELFHEEVTEAESDISALSISFLTVQAVRFAISGVLPMADGVEVPEVPRTTGCIVALYLVGVAFATGAAFLLCMGRSLRAHSAFSSLLTLAQNTWAMSFAWAWLFATRWLAIGDPTYQSVARDPHSMVGRLILALALSLVALVFIFVLDKIDDADIGGSDMGRVVQNFINALSILVGFSWEHCFEGGIEVLASVSSNPFQMKVFFTLGAGIVIIPAWRRYILSKVITLKQMHKELRKASGESVTVSCEEESERSDGEPVW